MQKKIANKNTSMFFGSKHELYLLELWREGFANCLFQLGREPSKKIIIVS